MPKFWNNEKSEKLKSKPLSRSFFFTIPVIELSTSGFLFATRVWLGTANHLHLIFLLGSIIRCYRGASDMFSKFSVSAVSCVLVLSRGVITKLAANSWMSGYQNIQKRTAQTCCPMTIESYQAVGTAICMNWWNSCVGIFNKWCDLCRTRGIAKAPPSPMPNSDLLWLESIMQTVFPNIESLVYHLSLTGVIWSRYSMVVIPKNWNLFSVNIFLAVTGFMQLARIYM